MARASLTLELPLSPSLLSSDRTSALRLQHSVHFIVEAGQLTLHHHSAQQAPSVYMVNSLKLRMAIRWESLALQLLRQYNGQMGRLIRRLLQPLPTGWQYFLSLLNPVRL